MPDVKPSPRAGAIRLSLMRADQKGTRSASVLAIVACIPGPRIDSRHAPDAIATPKSRQLHIGLRPKPQKGWSMIGPDPTEPIFRSNTVALWTPQDSLFTADETHQRPFLSRLGLVHKVP